MALQGRRTSFAGPWWRLELQKPMNFSDLGRLTGFNRNKAFTPGHRITSHPVDWANQVWDEVLANHDPQGQSQRAIAAQVLGQFAKSDSQKRMIHDFPPCSRHWR